MNSDRLGRLRATAEGKKILILTHNNPDPDAIAASWALHVLLRTKFHAATRMAYGGIIARAENRAMVRLLKIKMQTVDQLNLGRFDAFALVDTQPRAGNNSLPSSLRPSIVIDHHGLRRATSEADFADIRPYYGSSATILTEYLIEAGLPITKRLATALYYGIKADTQNLGRDVTEADYKAAISLYPAVQLKRLSQIEHPDLPRTYFVDFDRALHRTEIYRDIAFCYMGEVNPDMVALIADSLIRLSGLRWSFVLGRDEERFVFSLRSKKTSHDASRTARRLVRNLGTAGGHRMTAGGVIPVGRLSPERIEGLCGILRERFFRIVGRESKEGEGLLSK